MMFRRFILGWLLFCLVAPDGFAGDSTAPAASTANDGPIKVVVIPVRDQIAKPLLYVIRRGLKEAIDNGVNLVVLDMKTPGGVVGVTLEIMEALDKFPGETVTYVDDEAVSAGAIIASVTDEIYFAPKGVMGAAEVVFGTGQDVGESMKRKVNSYMSGKIEALSEGQTFRSDVLRAMMDPEFEFKIGERVIKSKGELLTLTSAKAVETYGDPPQPLLAAGIAENIEALVRQKLGTSDFEIKHLEVTWSEKLAQYLISLSPLLLAAGLVCLFIEFKTPGFGIFGISGGLLLAIVFFGNYIAGFSGHEPVLLFALGLLLVALEIFVFPGTVVLAVAGAILMLGSLIWSMADLWPNEPLTFSGDIFLRPIRSVATGMFLAFVLIVILVRFLPRRWIWDRLVLQATVTGATQMAGVPSHVDAEADQLIGRRGIAVTGLFPSGQIEIDGQRHDAQVAIGSVERGTPVVVTGRSEFGLRVEIAET